MKLHILSDLHLEFSQLDIPAVDAQILVLAGDIATGSKGIDFAKSVSSRYAHILYVMGNHEFYGHDISTMKVEIKNSAQNTNIHVLDNNVFTYENVDFIGSTLWTDFQLYSKDTKFVEMSKNIAAQSMNDFRIIRDGNTAFTAEKSAKLCLENQTYLISQLSQSQARKKVVITHHCPSKKSVAKKYEGDFLNSAFANNLDEIVMKSDLWIHGHTHSEFDYNLGDSRVVCNPRGYSKYQDKQENTEFVIDKVVEI